MVLGQAILHRRRRAQQQDGETNATLEAGSELTQKPLNEEVSGQPLSLMNGNNTSTKEESQDETIAGELEEEHRDPADMDNAKDENAVSAAQPTLTKNETTSSEVSVLSEHDQNPLQEGWSAPEAHDASGSVHYESYSGYSSSWNETDVHDKGSTDGNGTAVAPIDYEEITAQKMEHEKGSSESASEWDLAEYNSTSNDPTINVNTLPSLMVPSNLSAHSSPPAKHPLAPSPKQRQQVGGYGDFFLHYVAVLFGIAALLFWVQRLRRQCYQQTRPEEPRREGYQFV